MLLPSPLMGQALPDDVVLGRYLSGGVEVSCFSDRRLRSLVPNISTEALGKVIKAAGLGSACGKAKKPGVVKGILAGTPGSQFTLVGRPELELYFIEQVVDIVEKQEQYRAMGIEFPSSFVLCGEPGCGKTYAVERLAEYLDWPVFTIDSGSIGSKYIHETSSKIAEIFQTAMEQSPSMVIIDEMEAFLSERDAGGHHRIEEVAEFLRKIPEAQKHQVLIIGMTNRLDLIDPAVIRRGRFDNVIKVDMPSADEIMAVLIELFSDKPHSSDVDLMVIAGKLAGRPLSDVAHFVREAARLAAKTGKKKVDSETADTALSTVLSYSPTKKDTKIGF